MAYGGRQITEAFHDTGTELRELVMTGGGSQSKLWRQIHADVIGHPLLQISQPLPAALSAAICAAAGLGVFNNLPATSAAMSQITPAAEPNPRNRPAYDSAFRAYQETARALAPQAPA